MKRNYYIAEASWADKLVKNRAHPQWVHILNKEYLQTMLKYNGSTSFVDRIFPQTQFGLYNLFNCCQFKGKMDYKGEQDYMDVWPTFRGVFGVINEKFKKILDDLHVSTKEYVTYPISIENAVSSYYFMFVYQIPMEEMIFNQSIFCDKFNHEKEYLIESKDQFYDILQNEEDRSRPIPKRIVLDKKFTERHIIEIQSCPYVFFSEELVNRLNTNNIVGLEYNLPTFTELLFV